MAYHIYKIVLVGDCGTGKTVFLESLRKKRVNYYTTMTLTPNILHISYDTFKLEIIDMPSNPSFFKGHSGLWQTADAFLLFYDTTQNKCNLQGWIDIISKINTSASFFYIKTKIDEKASSISVDANVNTKTKPIHYIGSMSVQYPQNTELFLESIKQYLDR